MNGGSLECVDMLTARWREEAEQARQMAKKVKDDNVGMRTIHITRAMMLERCASDLEAAPLAFASLPTTSAESVAHHRMVRPFVVIDPYQYEGDIAFGMWVEEHQRYQLGDGDCYNAEELERSWKGDYTLLSWTELEARLKRPNGEAGRLDEA